MKKRERMLKTAIDHNLRVRVNEIKVSITNGTEQDAELPG